MPDAEREPTPPQFADMEMRREEGIGFGGAVKQMTRARYAELVAIGQHLCEALEKMGVKSWEGCAVREITERLWGLR